MSYQVLARKWRPQLFSQLVGQEHVVKALSNALDHDRLHHAYLFTGTRGVGKTTLARIFAKSLNCEQGVSAAPCGVCDACREIDEGRFVDLLEVDAASRTKVDQTRELLENVPYAPVRGRYKVYLIDEVHMFSASSFNALLKTLEEPPPHVKFILATTDPQKVPVTVLSRCLQFNLKRLSREQIESQLRHILQQEKIPYDDESLSLLARGADGSMRDGLSLLDQAIAFGGGQVKGAEVRSMIGTVGADQVYRLLDALAAQDGSALLQGVAEMSQLATDFTTATQELLAMLHQIALLQQVPDCVPDEAFDSQRLAQFAQQLAAEDVQLFYQIGLTGQRELHLAPDPRSGFEMLLLRMLAFRPGGGGQADGGQRGGQRTPTVSRTSESTSAKPTAKPVASPQTNPPSAAAPMESDSRGVAGAGDPAQWDSFVVDLKLGGIASQLANHCIYESWDGETLSLLLDNAHRHLRVGQAEARLQAGVAKALGRAVKLKITEAVPESETPAMRQAREQGERQRQAQDEMTNDPLVRELEEHFSARLVSDSVRPLD
jgi:DNA polymerase-3 subunit gamma/tau